LIIPLAYGLREPGFGGGATPYREQSIMHALSEAMSYRSFQLLMAGYFVCGFQVVFIGVHMPSYLRDHNMAPEVASIALALIGLFNVFGTYIAGSLGQRLAKRKILSFILARTADANECLHFLGHDGLVVALHGSPHERGGGTDFWCRALIDAGWFCVLQPPNWQFYGRVVGGLLVRPNRQLRRRLVHLDCFRRICCGREFARA
jgi:MFS family permease